MTSDYTAIDLTAAERAVMPATVAGTDDPTERARRGNRAGGTMQYLALSENETATVECHICFESFAACEGFVSTAGRFTCWRCVERERRLGPITEEEAHILAALAR